MGARSAKRRRGLIAMLVYRSAVRRAPASALLDEITALAGRVASSRAPADTWTEVLMACGELESAVTDAVCPERDESTPLTLALRSLTLAAAQGALAAWTGDDASAARSTVTRALTTVRGAITGAALSTELAIGIPEGFAYYALYPETYAAAARAFLYENDSPRITCIGIRSIGTTLSAVVAATALDAEREVASFTVRPRGHPFDRELVVGADLEDALAAEASRGAVFLVIDEGPGLSGSSFASVAEALDALGVPDARIVFFPSWIPKSEALRSTRGRVHWNRHEKRVCTFEQMFDGTEGLLEISRMLGVPVSSIGDVSAGGWRHLLFTDERDWPAVQPQHERRKYIARDENDAPIALLKFAGLGRHGRAAEQRARSLAEAGLAPCVIGAERGFLATEWVAGEPAFEGEVDAELLLAIAQHVAHLARTTRTSERVPFDEMLDIVRVNTGEGLGDDVARPLVAALERFRPVLKDVRTCAVDGRMLPHEWIRGRSPWIKTDGADHHDDHFLPGDQDPAWDVTGAIVELLLDAREARFLIDEYVRRSGDRDVAARLPFHHVAYLATRLGYVTLGAEAIPDSADGARLRALGRRYAAMLRRAAVTLGAIEPVARPDRWRGIRAIVFDADGTLRRTTVVGQPCPHAPAEWELLPWLADGILTRLPWGSTLALGAASNQDHVGYGHLTERQARALLRSMLVEATGVAPARDAIQLCPHVLEEACECRKPGEGMLRALLAHFDIPPHTFLFVGDAATDAEAARRAGVHFAPVDELAESFARSCTHTRDIATGFVTASAA